MTEEKERLSKTEYDKVGEMLLELIAECPYIPTDLKNSPNIFYQSMGTGKCIGIMTLPGAKYVKKYVSGSFVTQVGFRVMYKSSPTNNLQTINAQSAVDNIMGWLEDIDNLPSLSGGRTVTKITASNSFLDDIGDDKSTVFSADAVMEYEKKGA